jgi:Putative DNA-binding domain
MTFEELTQLLADPSFDESQFVDFKAEVIANKVDALAKDISSFANSMGGRLFIGVGNDKSFNNTGIQYPISNWKSMDSEDISNATRLKISKFLSHNLHFTVTPIARPHQADPILVIEVPTSETICGYRPTHDKAWEFWHRLDRQNSPMGIAQIIGKSLGTHHYMEQLTISREFAKLLIRRVGMVEIAIHQAYQNVRDGKFLVGQLIQKNLINKIGHLKEMVVSESEKTYENLSSLAFLSANISTDLKQLAISLTNKLAKITAKNSIWSLPNDQLDKLKANPITQPYDTRVYLLEESNALIKDYQSLLNVKEEIDQKIADLEAANGSSFSSALASRQVG